MALNRRSTLGSIAMLAVCYIVNCNTWANRIPITWKQISNGSKSANQIEPSQILWSSNFYVRCCTRPFFPCGSDEIHSVLQEAGLAIMRLEGGGSLLDRFMSFRVEEPADTLILFPCSAVNRDGQSAPRTGFFHFFKKQEVSQW